jgi:putative ABC transport system permease protein
MIQEYFIIAWKNLKKRKIRAWLTLIGIFISIATIFLLISLSLGLEQAVEQQFEEFGGDKFFISPKGTLGPPQGGSIVKLTLDDVEEIKGINGVEAVTYYGLANAELEFNNKKRFWIVISIPLDEEKESVALADAFNLEPIEGRLMNEEDKGKNIIAIGSRYNDAELFGKDIPLRSNIKINGENFKVIAIMKTIGNPADDQNIYMPHETFKDFFGTGDRVDQIIVQVDDINNVNEVAENVKRKLAKFRNVDVDNPDFDILTPEEFLEAFGEVLNILTSFLLGIAAISLIVGGLGIVNTMYTSVLERTKDIGTMKATGAKNKDILWIFVIESGMLGLAGGAIGVLIGISIGKFVEFLALNQLGINFLVVATPVWLVVSCLLFAFLVGSLSGLWPAYRASKIKPVDALRYE